MVDNGLSTRTCPFCTQPILKASVRCLHCLKPLSQSSSLPCLQSGLGRALLFALASLAIVFPFVHVEGLLRCQWQPLPNPPVLAAGGEDCQGSGSGQATNPDLEQAEYNRQDMLTAVAEFTREIRANPDKADGYIERGWAFSDLAEYDEAIADLSKAVALEPENANAFCKRAWVYNTMGMFKLALADAQWALRLAPANENAKEARQYARQHLD